MGGVAQTDLNDARPSCVSASEEVGELEQTTGKTCVHPFENGDDNDDSYQVFLPVKAATATSAQQRRTKELHCHGSECGENGRGAGRGERKDT